MVGRGYQEDGGKKRYQSGLCSDDIRAPLSVAPLILDMTDINKIIPAYLLSHCECFYYLLSQY